MDIANLQAFVAVADAGSFSQAAQQLHLSQPAVSKRITTLERELGTRLFDRIGRSVGLTEAGQALLPRARQILGAVEDSRRVLTNLSGVVAGRLSVGTSHHIGLHRLPPVLRRYSAEHPAVELDLHFMDSEAVCVAVEHGELELGIVTLPLEPPASLTTLPVWPDPLAVVSAPDHALVAEGRPSLARLAAYPAILPARGTYTREIMERAFAPAGIELQVRLSTNYLETIKMLVSIGLGWSVLPETMLDGELRAIALPGLDLARTLGVVHHRNRTLSNPAAKLIGLLESEGRQAPPSW